MSTDVLYRGAVSRLIQHLSFLSLSYYILVNVFSSSGTIQPTDYIYSAVFLFTVALCVYLNLFILIPRFLNKGRYVIYAISLISCIILCTYFNQLTFSRFIDYLLPGYYFISYYRFADILKFMVVFTGITSLVKLSKGYFLLLEERDRLMRLQKDRSEAEFQALRAQVNPHFLFNSLNSIYSMVLKQSDQAPGMILKLSEILRYILYETKKTKVSLATELDYMKDYIDLQRIRSGARATINVTVTGKPGNWEIAPLLFLPLIENSFKHGIKGETGPVFVTMEWTIGDRSVRFVAENNKGRADEIPGDDHLGIGLENLNKRLALTYPGQHRFEISETGDRFIVVLEIMSENET